jgi:phosphoglycolate phosphatase
MKYIWIVFDFDGTLYDSYPGISLAFSESTKRIYGVNKKLSKDHIGPKLMEIHNSLFDDNSKFSLFEKEFRELYDNNFCYEGVFFGGIELLLIELKSKYLRLGIVSNKPQKVLVNILKKFSLEKYFDFISGTAVLNKTPKYEMLNHQLCLLAVEDRKSVLVLGDTTEDYEMAQHNKCDFIFANYGYGKINSININSINAPNEILNYLR